MRHLNFSLFAFTFWFRVFCTWLNNIKWRFVVVVSFNNLPNSFNEFSTLVNEGLTVPQKTCALFICAVNILSQNTTEGLEAINLLKGPQPLSEFDKSWFKDRISDKKYLAMAYFNGATPENNYTPTKPYSITFIEDPRPQDCEPGYMRLQIKTPAFDSPRYMKLRQKGKNWYLWDVNSIMVGVRIPKQDDPWA